MDPTAQANPQPTDSQGSGEQKNPILPGQFIIAGETPSEQPPVSNISSPTPPAPQKGNPDELLNTLAQQVGGKALNQNQPTAQTAPLANPNQPEPMPDATQQPPLPIDIAQTQTQQPPSAPDPTPFIPPQGATPAQPTQGSPKSDKIKLVLIVLGVIVAVALIAGVAYFYFTSFAKKPAKIDNTQESTIEEPSPPPARTEGGFADVPVPTATESASVASPSPSPSTSTLP